MGVRSTETPKTAQGLSRESTWSGGDGGMNGFASDASPKVSSQPAQSVPASAPGFLLTRFPARLNPRVALRTGTEWCCGGWNRRPHSSISPSHRYREFWLHQINGKVGQNWGGDAENTVTDSPKDEGGRLKPCADAPFDRGLFSAVVPSPCAGVCAGKSAKAIRTFVPGHKKSNADTTHFSK